MACRRRPSERTPSPPPSHGPKDCRMLRAAPAARSAPSAPSSAARLVSATSASRCSSARIPRARPSTGCGVSARAASEPSGAGIWRSSRLRFSGGRAPTPPTAISSILLTNPALDAIMAQLRRACAAPALEPCARRATSRSAAICARPSGERSSAASSSTPPPSSTSLLYPECVGSAPAAPLPDTDRKPPTCSCSDALPGDSLGTAASTMASAGSRCRRAAASLRAASSTSVGLAAAIMLPPMAAMMGGLTALPRWW
mmetsp:Transcript_44424/g.113501  ORF Transcript_44424/g.113501 Transcript_44424/m.113501 type:complete len:257 (+) Transcript_44424:269-1039(+)